MINTEVIEHAIKISLYTAMLKKENPVSIILIAPPEHGKTEILKRFAFVNSVFMTTDFNTFVFQDFANEFQMKTKKTIVIPDFLRVVKKKYSVQSNSLTILNAITEEGWCGKLPLGQMIDKPVKANVITALTSDELADKRHKWSKLGFLSRFVPLSFSYNNSTKQQIREYIKDRIYRVDTPIELEIDLKNKIDVTLPKPMAEEIEHLAKSIAIKDNFTGFRLQRQLQVLAMGNALSNKRNIVNEDDIKVLREISYFINFKFNKL